MKAYINKRTHYECDYELKYKWPDNTILKPLYNKDENLTPISFVFDIFLGNPETIIYAEGKSFEECEDYAWNLYNKFINCPKHDFEIINKKWSDTDFACKNCGLIKIDDKEKLNLSKKIIANIPLNEYLIINEYEILNDIPSDDDWQKYSEVFNSNLNSSHLKNVAQEYFSKKLDGTKDLDEKIIFIKENKQYSETRKFTVGAIPVLEFYANEEDL
ncbi:hypothetical protein ACWNT8_15770 (plasmid) [Pigmentibacter ruber]